MARAVRAEALAALVEDGSARAPTRVLLDALAKVPASDDRSDAQNVDSLLGMLLGQPADVLRQQREVLAQAAADGQPAAGAARRVRRA